MAKNIKSDGQEGQTPLDDVSGLLVDVKNGVVAFGGEYHMDANTQILKTGSVQPDVWGFNVYVDRPRGQWIEFTSLINIRPEQGNTTMEIEDAGLRTKIQEIVNSKII